MKHSFLLASTIALIFFSTPFSAHAAGQNSTLAEYFKKDVQAMGRYVKHAETVVLKKQKRIEVCFEIGQYEARTRRVKTRNP